MNTFSVAFKRTPTNASTPNSFAISDHVFDVSLLQSLTLARPRRAFARDRLTPPLRHAVNDILVASQTGFHRQYRNRSNGRSYVTRAASRRQIYKSRKRDHVLSKTAKIACKSAASLDRPQFLTDFDRRTLQSHRLISDAMRRSASFRRSVDLGAFTLGN